MPFQPSEWSERNPHFVSFVLGESTSDVTTQWEPVVSKLSHCSSYPDQLAYLDYKHPKLKAAQPHTFLHIMERTYPNVIAQFLVKTYCCNENYRSQGVDKNISWKYPSLSLLHAFS